VTPNDGPDTAAADPDQAHPPTDQEARRRDDAPPGSVAAEAALLVDLLSRRSWTGASGSASAGPRQGRAGREAPGHDHPGGPTSPHGDSGAREDAGHDGGSPPGQCTCGGTTPAACRACPVCQLIAFVQQVNPDTIEKVADFVGFAATALRDLATAQRERRTDDADPRAHPDADHHADPGGDRGVHPEGVGVDVEDDSHTDQDGSGGRA
jgi:hypothetical protein